MQNELRQILCKFKLRAQYRICTYVLVFQVLYTSELESCEYCLFS